MQRIEYEEGRFLELYEDDSICGISGQTEILAKYEAAIFRKLIQSPNTIVYFDTMAEEVWGHEIASWSEDDIKKWIEDSFNNPFSKLKQKILKVAPDAGHLIERKRGVGCLSKYLRIAKEGYDYQKKDVMVERLLLSDEYKNIAPLSGEYYCERPLLVSEIDKAFKKSRLVYILGISGIGKTELARFYGMKRNFRYVIPLALKEDGSGDYRYLVSQIKSQSNKEDINISSLLSGLDYQDLIIIDNYNDANNQVIIEFFMKNSEVKVLVTSQILADDMDEHGIVVSIDEVEHCQNDERTAFAVKLFCTYAGLSFESLDEESKKSLEYIVRVLGYHTMIICMLGRQYRKSNRTLKTLSDIIEKNIVEVLQTDIKVSIVKDFKRLTQIPYELLKLLFKNQLIARCFSEMERQVIGATILCEKYTSNLELLCELVGDMNAYNGYAARNAFYRLQEDGVLSIQESKVYMHPLLRALVCDVNLEIEGETPIAELSYEFLVHLMRNKLVENKHVVDINVLQGNNDRNLSIWYTWLLDMANEIIIPKECERNEGLKDCINKESYFIAICHSEDGASLYIHFESEQEICLINGSMQRRAEYRYFKKNIKMLEGKYKTATLIENHYDNCNRIVIPNFIANAPVNTLGIALFINNKMKYVEIPDSVGIINDYAFCDCTELEEIIIPDSVFFIGVRAFINCVNAKKLVLGSGVQVISMAAFSRCRSLAGKLIVPDSVERIYRYAFYQCSNIQEVKLSENIKEMGTCCFSGCRSIKSIEFGSGLRHLSREVFSECQSLEMIVVPGNVSGIEEDAFSACKNLKSVVCKEGVERIENHAFYACQNLECAKLPNSITFLGKAVFGECPNVIVEIEENSTADKFLQDYNIRIRAGVTLKYK